MKRVHGAKKVRYNWAKAYTYYNNMSVCVYAPNIGNVCTAPAPNVAGHCTPESYTMNTTRQYNQASVMQV